VGSPPKKKQKITKWLIVKIVVIAAITIALFFVGHYAIPSAALPPGSNPPTMGEVVGLAIITISEAAVTGVGLAFLISYARYLPRTPKVIKPKIYSVYISICWFLIQWFPHSQLHKMFGPDVNALIGLEMTFHWVNVVALSILAYYQFDIMMLCMALTRTKENLARLEKGEKTREEMDREQSVNASPIKRFFVNTKVHVVAIVIVFFFVLFFGVQRVFPKSPFELTEVQSGLLIAIEVVASITFGIGAAFAILMAINISRNIAPRYHRTAWASYVAICYIFLTDYFHGKTHGVIRPDDYIGLIVIEIFFHIGVTAAAFILIYYQRKVIKAAWLRRQKRDAVGTSVTLSTSAGGNQSSSTKRDDEPEK
jgi:hypothetical protein